MEKLTDKQQAVLDFVTEYSDRSGTSPTLREISEHIGTKGTATALMHLQALERKGFVKRRDGNSRNIILPDRGNSVAVPLVGRVKAGPLKLATEDIEGHYRLDKSWVRGNCFLLRVDGDSMIDDHIIDGDLVLIRQQNTADQGDIVVAMIDDEATLKRFYREGDYIRLEARNPNYASIVVRAEVVTIIGKAIKIVRDID
jgi:repressor LexA